MRFGFNLSSVLTCASAACLVVLCDVPARGQELLTNANLDKCYAQEITPGFFLPKPRNWQNVGSRTITGPYEDEMSSEPWAGPAPTPVTTDGDANPPDGIGIGNDGAVFFKPFSGGASDGPATGHLFQDVPATVGTIYRLTGWAGAEANSLMAGAEMAVEFVNAAGTVIPGSSTTLNLLPTLTTPNGQPFSYKQYTVLSSAAPVNAASVRARVSMIGGQPNPAGGGQAYVVDDFSLTVIPEPASLGALALAAVALPRRRQRT